MIFRRIVDLRLSLMVLCLGVFALLALPVAAETSQSNWRGSWGRTAPATELAQTCFPVGRRACGFRNGRWRNYRNRCYARRAGARSIRLGRCRASANCASQPARPVCGTWRGRRINYRNLCYARRSNATNIRFGRCQAAGCSDNRPVCGTWRGRRYTFRNICQARRRRATNIRIGRCRPARTCHRAATSQRYPHIQGRSWNPACRPTGGGGGGGPKVGDVCRGKDPQGVPFTGRYSRDVNGILTCLSPG